MLLDLYFRADQTDIFSFMKVCNKLSDDDVMLENFGSVCKVQCPDCGKVKKMASYVNKDTGKCTFSMFNFTRHHETHSDAHMLNEGSNAPDDITSGPTASIGESSKQSKLRYVLLVSRCFQLL